MISRILEPIFYKGVDYLGPKVEGLIESLRGKDLEIGFQEVMHGSYGEEKKEFTFDVEITKKASTLVTELTGGKPLARFEPTPVFDFEMDGIVTMEDICEEVIMQDGIFMIVPLTKQLIYTFKFQNEGRDFTYRGAKDLSLRNPIHSMTHLYGSILEKGDYLVCENYPCSDICNGVHLQIANKWQAESYFDLKELPEFLKSFVTGVKLI